MSQGCNFINSLMSASRRRSASVTPPTPPVNSTIKIEQQTKNRRASSSNNLATPSSGLINKSSSGNHLNVASISNETICSNDSTQTSRTTSNDDYVPHSDFNTTQPLAININAPAHHYHSSQYYAVPMSASHPISLDDILQMDLDNLRLEDECKNLENQIQHWEKKVDDLERKRYGEDVPRTIVEKVLRQRKLLRQLDFEIYKLNLEESDRQSSQKLSISPNRNSSETQSSHSKDDNFNGLYQVSQSNFESQESEKLKIESTDSSSDCRGLLVTGRIGSHIRPGQENTADILDAVPPSGSLQQRLYLNRASTITDSSNESQQPSFYQHRHHLPAHHDQPMNLSSDDGSSMSFVDSREFYQQKRHNFHQRQYQSQSKHHSRRKEKQIYVQLETGESNMQVDFPIRCDTRRQTSPPKRPNYFKDDFRIADVGVPRDSSSTASSGSPH